MKQPIDPPTEAIVAITGFLIGVLITGFVGIVLSILGVSFNWFFLGLGITFLTEIAAYAIWVHPRRE